MTQPPSKEKVSGEEVAELLRQAIRGEVAVKLAHAEWTWEGTYAGDVGFVVGDWRVTIFNDCDELDYIDSVTAPDGRTGDFDQWWDDNHSEPTCFLDASEQAALERLLEEAR